jgi:uncharacterized protein YjbI with pentapeptide repeats
MANADHLEQLLSGVPTWRWWRRQRPELVPDLTGAVLRKKDLRGALLAHADLSGADLSETVLSDANLVQARLDDANLTWADLRHADLTGASLAYARLFECKLTRANLRRANLTRASLIRAELYKADLSGANLDRSQPIAANLTQADLRDASLRSADLTGTDILNADLSGADLSEAALIRTNLGGADLSNARLANAILADANLSGARVHNLTVWEARIEDCLEDDLVVTPRGHPRVTVAGLRNAQLVQLLLRHPTLSDAAHLAMPKVALIVGDFPPRRRSVATSLRAAFARRGCVPIVFHFEPAVDEAGAETLSTLARVAASVVVDLTGPEGLGRLADHAADLGVKVQYIAREPVNAASSADPAPSDQTIRRYRGADRVADGLGAAVRPPETTG